MSEHFHMQDEQLEPDEMEVPFGFHVWTAAGLVIWAFACFGMYEAISIGIRMIRGLN